MSRRVPQPVRRTLGRLRRASAAARYRRIQRRLAAPRVIAAFADAYPSAFFVEIGANDGEQHDHLRPFILGGGWRGIMVEPVPYIFERLERNYGEADGVALENAAIADRDGTLPFYHLVDAAADERARLPSWYDGVGSFSREKVLAHQKSIPDIADRVVRREVPCLTFESLCRRHGADRVDLVVIDTEGYDAEIIRTIDLERFAPRLLVFEHFHLSPADRESCLDRLRAAGYETLAEGFDTFCLLPGPDDSLDRAWARLEPAVPAATAADES